MNQLVQHIDPSFSDASDVAAYVLEAKRAAYMDRDFEAFARRMHLPNTVGTFLGDRVLETRDELQVMFNAMCQRFVEERIIDMRRSPIAARFVDAHHVQVTFTAQDVYSDFSLSSETVGHGIIRFVEEAWKLVECRYATRDTKLQRALNSSYVE